MLTNKKRVEYIDNIKGIAIFLVVWGHTIQNMGKEDEFWNNPIFYFICSFHMPLFMLLSGYFFNKISIHNLPLLIKKKFRQLILPCFGWSIIVVLLNILFTSNNNSQYNLFEVLKDIFYETGTRFWFLRSVFICYILTALSMRTLKKDWIAFIVSFILFLMLSDNLRLALDKFMYPFFWVGYFMHKYKDYIEKYRNQILCLSFSIFVFMLLFWKKDYYIYITGMSFYYIDNMELFAYHLFERISIITYRYLIGLSGSISVFLFIRTYLNNQNKLLSEIGKKTLGIYVIHIIIEGKLLSQLDLSQTGFFLFNFVITPATSILLICFCILIINMLQKNKYVNTLMLGAELK